MCAAISGGAGKHTLVAPSAARAILLLRQRYPEGDERRDWLFGASAPKWSLLAELGRLLEQQGKGPFWEATGWVVSRRPKVKAATRAIRSVRTGRHLRADGSEQT